MTTEPFIITAAKETFQITLKYGGADFSKAECRSAFSAIDEKLEIMEETDNFILLPNRSLKITALLPDDEPWETNVEILSNGFTFEEINKVVLFVKKQLNDLFKSIHQ